MDWVELVLEHGLHEFMARRDAGEVNVSWPLVHDIRDHITPEAKTDMDKLRGL
jgi:hypothetical protein